MYAGKIWKRLRNLGVMGKDYAYKRYNTWWEETRNDGDEWLLKSMLKDIDELHQHLIWWLKAKWS